MSITTTRVSIVIEHDIPGWSAYPVTLSQACAPKGDAQCDGFDYDLHVDCDCPCHVVGNLPGTVVAIKQWHDDLHAGLLNDTLATL